MYVCMYVSIVIYIHTYIMKKIQNVNTKCYKLKPSPDNIQLYHITITDIVRLSVSFVWQ